MGTKLRTKIYKTTFKLRRGASDEWKEKNPVLLDGEPGFEINTYKLKIGDGQTEWNNLQYVGDDIKTIISRKTSEEWNSIGDTYIPKNGELVIYTTSINENGIPVFKETLKIGDGIKTVNQLNFLGSEETNKLKHKLTIGDTVFDGSKDVTIRTYGGDYE